MGKHSAPKASRRNSAAGILAVMDKRPRMAAIVVPVAAGALVLGSTAVVTGTQSVADGANVSTVSAQEAVAQPGGDLAQAQSDEEFLGEQTSKKGFKKAVKTKAVEANLETPAAAADSAGGTGADAGAVSSSGGVSNKPCKVSSGVEKNFKPNAVKVYRAVCAKYPQVKTFGGYRNDPGSDHGTGHAVDIMISGSTGDSIRDYAIKNAKALGVKYVIWEQKLYAPYTNNWQGRPMPDRGSATANHFDHVHVSVN